MYSSAHILLWFRHRHRVTYINIYKINCNLLSKLFLLSSNWTGFVECLFQIEGYALSMSLYWWIINYGIVLISQHIITSQNYLKSKCKCLSACFDLRNARAVCSFYIQCVSYRLCCLSYSSCYVLEFFDGWEP